MSKVEDVHRLIKKYFWEMPDDASLSRGKNCVLPEEAFEFFEEYAELFSIDMKRFDFRLYFPGYRNPFFAERYFAKISAHRSSST